MISQTEENYLKALLKLSLLGGKGEAGTNELANLLGVKPATANDMLKKLKEKSEWRQEERGKNMKPKKKSDLRLEKRVTMIMVKKQVIYQKTNMEEIYMLESRKIYYSGMKHPLFPFY